MYFAAAGLEAVEACKKNMFDVVFMDMQVLKAPNGETQHLHVQNKVGKVHKKEGGIILAKKVRGSAQNSARGNVWGST
jgi:CheY-like chemotaxis protein